jgi:chromate transport protein ChrA
VDGGSGKNKWLDEQTYQELFAICQALPGPGSTKMLFCIAQIHAGIVHGIFAFLIWSLPGAIGMYGLSLGIQKVPDKLPPIVYALLSGLNAGTVGIIALAAVQVWVQLLDQSVHKQNGY